MSLEGDLAEAVDAVYAGLPNLVPKTFNLATARLPNQHPYNNSPWLCFVIRCATNCELEFVRAALKAGADPNMPHETRNCKIYPLHLAIKHGLPDVAMELLQRGADRYAKTSSNRTADDILECIRHLEMPETVLELEKVLQS